GPDHFSDAHFARSFCAPRRTQIHKVDTGDQEDKDSNEDKELHDPEAARYQLTVLHALVEVLPGDRLCKDLPVEPLPLRHVLADDVPDLVIECGPVGAALQKQIGTGIGDLPSRRGRIPSELFDIMPGYEVLKSELGVRRKVFQDTRHREIVVAVDDHGLSHRLLIAKQTSGDMLGEDNIVRTGQRGAGVPLEQRKVQDREETRVDKSAFQVKARLVLYHQEIYRPKPGSRFHLGIIFLQLRD